jgi:hypothetical protein
MQNNHDSQEPGRNEMRYFTWKDWCLYLIGLVVFSFVMATRQEIPNIWIRAMVVGVTVGTLVVRYQVLSLRARNRRKRI